MIPAPNNTPTICTVVMTVGIQSLEHTKFHYDKNISYFFQRYKYWKIYHKKANCYKLGFSYITV